MNVLQLISSRGVYGAETMMLTLASALAGLGCGTTVGVFENLHLGPSGVAEAAAALGLDVVRIPCRGRMDAGAVDAVRAVLRARTVDVVHTHGYKAELYGYAAARPSGVPLVATCHNWAGRTGVLWLYSVLDRIVMGRFDRVAAVSDSVRAKLRPFVGDDRLAVIPNGVDVERFRRARPSLDGLFPPGCGPRVGLVGRLVRDKGPHLLLEAAARLLPSFPDAVFVLVGDGPARPELEALAASLGVAPRVVFTGERRDMAAVHASLDLFVLPSLNEGMPMTVLEAMAAGRPVVASRVGGIPDAVLDGLTGLLVAPSDVAALTAALHRLLADPALASAMGERGRARAVDRFSSRAMAARYLDLYRDAMGSARAIASASEFRHA